MPTASSDFHVRSSAPGRNDNVSDTASSTFGPPGWLTHVPMSGTVSPCSPRNPRTSPPRYARTTSGTSAPSTIRNPPDPTSHPITRSESG